MSVIPSQEYVLIALASSMGLLLGEGGSKFDYEIKYGSGKQKFDLLNPIAKLIVDFILNLTHHFQYGLLAIYLGYHLLAGDVQTFLFWFGLGLIISDWKDYKNILKRLGISVTSIPPIKDGAIT